MTNKTKGDIPDPGTEEAARLGSVSERMQAATEALMFGKERSRALEINTGAHVKRVLQAAFPELFSADPPDVSRLLEALKRATEP